jgi:hypothetical protein
MYLLLLVFGGLLGAAGVLLALAGMSLRDGSFDPAILTPGIVAAAGGLLLIGLGAGLRTLQRIERTLASRPMPRALPSAESAKPPESAETPRDPVRIPFAPKATPDAQPAVPSTDIFGAKPSEPVSVADKLSPAVIAIAAVHDANVETRAQASGKNGNGAGGMQGLRLPARLRPASAGERQSEPIFEALWPKGPRPARTVEPASVPTSQGAGVTARESQSSADASNLSTSNPENAAAGLSVLKSGVVNGMPYTLYSDGSIEAQLPEGTLRFGSITELRNHIEQSA